MSDDLWPCNIRASEGAGGQALERSSVPTDECLRYFPGPSFGRTLISQTFCCVNELFLRGADTRMIGSQVSKPVMWLGIA